MQNQTKKYNLSFNPLVSIIIPIYNGSNYMKEAIDSALAQTYKNIEIIVVNDGSTDNTDEIARSYGDKIRYFKKENGGVATALNLAIKEAKGDYISWLSHDDVYYKNKIEAQIEVLNNLNDKNTVLFSDIETINENGIVVSKRILKDKFSNPNDKLPLFWLLNGLIHGCSLLIKKDIYFEFNLFDENLFTVQDYYLWYDIFKKYNVYYIDKILIQSREHTQQGHLTLKDYTQKEQSLLWSKIIQCLTINEVAQMSNVSIKSLKADENTKNIQLCYAPREVLKAICKLNKKSPFSCADVKCYLKQLPQYKKQKFTRIINNFFVSIKAIFFALLFFFKAKNNTILMFEPNPYHGETFAGYINYFSDLGYKVHFIAQKTLSKENPFTRLQHKINDKKLEITYIKMSKCFIETFFKMSFLLKNYKNIFITSNMGYFKGIPLIISKTMSKKLLKKAIFIEHDTDNFIKADEKNLIKSNQIATLIKRKFQESNTLQINPCTFGKVKKSEFSENIINFMIIGCINKDYKGHYLIKEVIFELINSGYTNFKFTIIGSGNLKIDDEHKKYIDFKGRLNFEDMFKNIEQAQYILFLLDEKNKEHHKYINRSVTGALQLALGFKIIPILHKKFADIYNLSNKNALIQDGESLASVLKKAINTKSDEYNNMQKNLNILQNEYYNTSLEALNEFVKK